MISPEQLAKDLYNKFYDYSSHRNSITVRHEAAIRNALICVDVIISFDTEIRGLFEEVKKELNKL
jgi:hypothetical protein